MLSKFRGRKGTSESRRERDGGETGKLGSSRYPTKLSPPLVGLEMKPRLFGLLDGLLQLCRVFAHAGLSH